jgi:hypothetical protein
MASPYKPELFTLEDVMNYFAISKGSCFKIYAGTNPKADDFSRGECSDGDKNIAEERLSECLISLKQNVENTNPYTLQVYNLDKKGLQIDKNCIIFQLNRPERYNAYPAMIAGTGDARLASLIEKSIEQQNLIISKLSAQEVEEEEEEEPEAAGVLGKIMEREEVQNFMVNAALNFVSGLMNKGMAQAPTYGGGVAGTVDQESISLLQQLYNKGVTNDTLQKLNEMSPAKLQSLLLML